MVDFTLDLMKLMLKKASFDKNIHWVGARQVSFSSCGLRKQILRVFFFLI